MIGVERLFVEGDAMKSQTIGLRVAGILFGLAALAQAGRLAFRPEILVAGYRLPLWPSALAVIVLAGMSAWMWILSRGSNT
jgi:hypothetical protein